MSATSAVFRRELKGYFGTPVAYVFLVVFLALSAHLAWSSNLYEARDASLRVFFANLPTLFALMAPAIAMRMWAEERRSGTIELLFTLPITTRQAVLGKFTAGWVFFLIALLLSLPMVFAVSYLGDPDNGPIFSGYLGAALMAGAYLAIGTFFSVLTKNQVIAFVLGAMACFLFVFAGSPSFLTALDAAGLGWLSQLCQSVSFLTHYDVLQRGLIEFRNIFFMLVLTAAFLIGSCIMLDERKAG
jgi:ABC-2 type transport system permease protein